MRRSDTSPVRRGGSVALVLLLSVALVLVGTGSARANSLKAYALQHGGLMAGDLLAQSAGSNAPRTATSLAAVTTTGGYVDSVVDSHLSRSGAVTSATPTAVGRVVPANVRPPRIKPPGVAGLILNTGAVALALGGLLWDPSDELVYEPGADAPAPPVTSRGVEVLSSDPWSTVSAAGLAAPDVATPNGQVASGWRVGIVATSSLRFQYRSFPSAGATTVTRPDGRAVVPGGDVDSGGRSCSSFALYSATSRPDLYDFSYPRIFQNPSVPYVDVTCAGTHTFASDGGNPTPGASTPATVVLRVYNPAGGAEPVPEVATLTSTVECRGPAGVLETVTATADVIIAPGESFRPPSAVCPAGQVAVSGKVDGSWDGQTVPMVPATVAPAWVGTLPDLAPECVNGGCSPELQTMVEPGVWLQCSARPDLCVGWQTLTPSEQNDRLRCRMGGATVSFDACRAQVFDPSAPANPSTQLPAPLTPGSPSLSPVPGGQPAPGPSVDDGCPPAFSVTNLLNGYLVYKGVSCALSWAFVPSPATATRVEGIGTSLTAKTPAAELSAVMLWLEPPELAGRCFEVAADWPMPGGFGLPERTELLDTCGDGPTMTALRAARPFLLVAVWVGMLAPLAWWAWREYAPGAKGVA